MCAGAFPNSRPTNAHVFAQVSAAAGYVAFCGAAPDNVLDGRGLRLPNFAETSVERN